MGEALGIFSLKLGMMGDSDSKAVVGYLLSRVFEGLEWLTVKIPIDILIFLLCRPE
jgi:hypothetical protein